MARNTLAGKSSGTSRSAKYYASNPEAKKKKQAYDKSYHSTPVRRKYRADLNKANKKAKTYGNKDNKDMSHKRGGGLISEAQSKNRARNRSKK